MKLSNDFTLFGLNIKAIQSHLKEQAKDQRGIRVTRRGDLVYIMTPHTAFKLPAMLYPDIIQPVTLRECPADGVTIVSAQYGFEVDEHAPDLVDIFKSAACKEKTVQRTPFLQDMPTHSTKPCICNRPASPLRTAQSIMRILSRLMPKRLHTVAITRRL